MVFRLSHSFRPDGNRLRLNVMFRGAELNIAMKRESDVTSTEVYVNGDYVEDGIIRDLAAKCCI